MTTEWPEDHTDPCLFETWAQWASIAEPARAQDEAPAQGTGRAAASIAENLPERQRTRWNVPEKNVYPADKQTARVTQTAGTVTSPPVPLENSGTRNRVPAKTKKERPNRRTHWDLGNLKPDCHYDKEEWQVCGHYCPWHQERAEEHHLHYLKEKTICEVCGEVHDRYFPRCPTLPFEEYTPGEEWPSEDATLAIESSANNTQGLARETLLRFKGKVADREA